MFYEYEATDQTSLILEFLSLKRGCTCLSDSIHVKMPHCWKAHVAVHICLYVLNGGVFLTRLTKSIQTNVITDIA